MSNCQPGDDPFLPTWDDRFGRPTKRSEAGKVGSHATERNEEHEAEKICRMAEAAVAKK